MKKFSAFTLAEVLITLGIIGVVAAMTMPTLINQTNGAQYRAAFKKELSVISQAVTLNVALEDFDFSDLTGTTTGNGKLTDMLQNRANVVRVASTSDLSTEGYKPTFDSDRKQGDTDNKSIGTLTDGNPTGMGDTAVMFNDGSMFIYTVASAAGCSDTTATVEGTTKSNKCIGWFDVNGMKGPNKETKCDSGDDKTCSVKIPTDIFPVQFYDQTILPNSGAGRAVLYDNGNTATRADGTTTSSGSGGS